MSLIFEHKPVDISVDYCNQYASDFDRLIKIGAVAYDPVNNQTVDEFNPGTSVGLYTITANVFSKFQPSNGKLFPMYPLLVRAFSNGIDQKVYEVIRELYLQCKKLVTQEYNTVLFNLGQGPIFRHSHQYAAPKGMSVMTQVFVIRLTDFNEPNVEFRIYHNADCKTYKSKSLNQNCMMKFDGTFIHEVIATDDKNYYGYFVFEKWHE
jgi:hypothetical protein